MRTRGSPVIWSQIVCSTFFWISDGLQKSTYSSATQNDYDRRSENFTLIWQMSLQSGGETTEQTFVTESCEFVVLKVVGLINARKLAVNRCQKVLQPFQCTFHETRCDFRICRGERSRAERRTRRGRSELECLWGWDDGESRGSTTEKRMTKLWKKGAIISYRSANLSIDVFELVAFVTDQHVEFQQFQVLHVTEVL